MNERRGPNRAKGPNYDEALLTKLFEAGRSAQSPLSQPFFGPMQVGPAQVGSKHVAANALILIIACLLLANAIVLWAVVF